MIRSRHTTGSQASKIAALFCVSVLLCGILTCGSSHRRKPGSIPEGAVWAGGPDGGAWILCNDIAGTKDRYACTIFNDHFGNINAVGEYVIRHYSGNEMKRHPLYSDIGAKPDSLAFTSFDGVNIRLSNSRVLLPDGWIDYPFNGGGKRQLYHRGVTQGEAVEYRK